MESERFGRYRLIQHLATGGMGELYLAECDRPALSGSSEQVVIKRIRQELVDDPIFVRAFLDEGRVASLITHPNIVRIHSMDEIDGTYYMAMEYVQGKDLGSLLATVGGPLDLTAALHVMNRLCEGLGYAHNATGPDGQPLGLVHRDINPQNVLIGYSGAVKLTDFGIAKVCLEHRERTRTGIIKGKFGYMAPEQAKGVVIDRRCDIYSLGLLLFEMTTGEQAVCGSTDQQKIFSALHGEVRQPGDLIRDYPDKLEQIYHKATAKDPAGRYQEIEELQNDLVAFCTAQRLRVDTTALAQQMQRTYTDEWEEQGKGETVITPAPVRREPRDSLLADESRTSARDILLADESRASASDLLPIPMEDGPDVSEIDALEPTEMSPADQVAAPTARSEIDINEPTRQDTIRRVFQLVPTGPPEVDEVGPSQDTEPFEPIRDGDSVSRDKEIDRPEAPKEEPTQLQAAGVDLRPEVGSVAPRQDAGGQVPEPEPPVAPQEAKTEKPPILPSGTVEPSLSDSAGDRDWMEPVHELTETIRVPGRHSHRRRLAIVISLALMLLACLAGMAYHLARRGQRPEQPEVRSQHSPLVKAREVDKRPAEPTISAVSKDAASGPARIVDAGDRPAEVSSAHGLLRLTVTPPVSVLWNKRPLGQTPLEVSLPPGKHRLFLRSEHPHPEVRLLRGVKIEPQETTVINWKLAKGRLEITAQPSAQVKINGRKRGITPVSFDLYEGVCQVQLFHPQSQKSYVKLVTIRPGRTSRVAHRFGE